MSELGLGLEREEEERDQEKNEKEKKHGNCHCRIMELDGCERSVMEKGTPFSSSNHNVSSPHYDQSFTSIVSWDNVLEEESEEENLDPENYSVSLSLAVTREDLEQREEVAEETLAPANHSFTRSTIEECQNSRVRIGSLPLPIKKHQLPRTASLDLNSQDGSILSPQFFVGGIGGLKKSPWTPNYQKGWSSERVPLPVNGSHRYRCNNSLFPLSTGRAIPSKWEDAEKWIGSPVSIDGTGMPLVLPSYYRRPKSKSGPLGVHSPLVPCYDSRRVVNVLAGSPLLAGVLVADRQCCDSVIEGIGSCGGGGRSYSANMEPYAMQPTSVHGWSDISSQGTIQDEKLDSKEGSLIVSPKVLHKDTGTHMSPEESSRSSPKKRSLPSSSLPSADPIVELETHFSKLEVRDVQVDDQVIVTRQSKKYIGADRRLRNIIEWKNRTEEDRASSWYNREEAKIRAWENLQEAKAAAAIRKLEMKLEKEKSSAVEKILNKLGSSQRKAQEMRSTAKASRSHQVTRTPKRASFFSKASQMNSFSSCFTCHAS